MAPAETLRGGKSQHGISKEQILDRALVLGDANGLEALTMRRLAKDLDVGTMTLYNYFRNKDELLDAMADVVLGRLDLPDLASAPRDEVIRAVARSFRRMMRAHPSVIRLFSMRSTRSHGAMAGSYEQPLQILISTGVDRSDAIKIYGLILTYVLGFVTYELPRDWAPVDGDEDSTERARLRRAFYESLPARQFPVLTGSSEDLVQLPSDEQFEWGLAILVAGTNAAIEPPGSEASESDI